MAITDLMGYTWVGNDTLNVPSIFPKSINFVSNSINFNGISFRGGQTFYLFYGASYNEAVYSFIQPANTWFNEAYKTIQITGGTDATDSTLIAWLEANGTLTPPQPQNVTLDLSTIGLPEGTHSIQIKLSDDSLTKRDSALSNAVTYTVYPTYTITPMLTNVTADSANPTTIQGGSTATLHFTAASGYVLPDSVTVTGATSSWDKTTGTLTLSNPTSNVTVTIVGQQPGGQDFANDSWTTIFNTVRAGTAQYQIGDIKEDTFGDYTVHWRFTDNQNGRYSYADGSGTSKAVIELVEVTSETAMWNASGSASSYNASDIKSYIDDLVAELPVELQNLLKAVNVYSGDGTQTASASTNVAASCKLFAPCANEIYNVGSTGYGFANDSEGTPQFDWYREQSVTTSSYAACIKHGMEDVSTAQFYWLRSPSGQDEIGEHACIVNDNGELSSAYVGNENRVALCFAI